MTDWDSEAARDVLNHGTTISQFRLALGATLARLAEVEAERDAARRETAEARDDALTAAMNHNAAMRAVMAERDSYRDAIKRYDAVHDNLAAENARLRPVVEAAEAWREPWTEGWVAALIPERRQGHSASLQLIAAVDAYRAGQKAPETAPESSVGQDLHPDGPGSTSDTPEAHRLAGAVIDYHFKNVPKSFVAPANPPGLDAAIEAAAEAMGGHGLGRTDADRNHVCTCERWADCAGEESWDEHLADIAIRAAAPALRAGELRDAADAIDNTFPRPWTVHFAQWLRERADREVAS